MSMFYKIMCLEACCVQFDINAEAYLNYPSRKLLRTVIRDQSARNKNTE